MFDPEGCCAVWDGRFQPLHRGHVAVMERILDRFDAPLVVMVIQSSVVPGGDAYTREADRHHAAARNPLTLWERCQMLDAVVEAEGWRERVRVLGILRPDLFWPQIQPFYPPRRFMILTGKDDYERAKAGFWAGLGETCATLDCAGLPAISASEVKANLRAGTGIESWLHPATHDYFRRIDGIERFRAAAV
jgi:cytidyltransferase-like protein